MKNKQSKRLIDLNKESKDSGLTRETLAEGSETLQSGTRIVAMADLHCQTPEIPDGDILILPGDLTWRGNLKELERVCRYLGLLPHKHKIAIAGNHDWCFQQKIHKKAEKMLEDVGVTYLKDSGVDILGTKIYGSPWQPEFHAWAFNVNRGDLHHHWDKIPNDLDILVVHGPPYGYGDMTTRGERVGCEELALNLTKTKPKYVFYGHIHEDTGIWSMNNGLTKLYNCSIGPDHSLYGKDAGKPVVVDI